MEDREIVALFLARDEDAVAQTQEKYGGRLRRLAYDLTGELHAAEECENDTYLQAWNSIPPHEPYDYFYPFLARIARHIALNFCRDRNRLKRKASVEELNAELGGGIDPAAFADEAALQALLNGFLRELKPEKRKIFIRRYWYLDSVQTIAEGFGISQSKVKVTLYRCREQLRKTLEREGYDL